MNSQELRALQEAYSQVYELDESLDKEFASMRKRGGRSAPPEERSAGGERSRNNKDYWADVQGANRDRGKGNKSAKRVAALKEDLYDIILSHLLDEGYADTEQAAEAIMVNMSEDWRESIMEADSLAAMAARREKRLKAQRKREGTSATGQDFGHNYGQTAAQREAGNKAEFDAFIKRKK